VDSGSDAAQTNDWLWDAQQEHVASMLAHFLFLICARLGPRFSPETEEKFIVPILLTVQTGGKFTWITAGAKDKRSEGGQPCNEDFIAEAPGIATEIDRTHIPRTHSLNPIFWTMLLEILL